MNTRLDCEFIFGHCNGTMTMQVFSGQTLLQEYSNVAQKHVVLTSDIDLPTQLQFKLSGKDPNHDTWLDADGNIIADKYIVLNSLKIGLIEVNQNLLFTLCSNNNTFWGKNEIVTIDILDSDFIQWHLKQKNKFKIHN